MDPVDNTATACGRDALTGPNDPATCGDDHHHLDVLHPALAVDKKVNGADHATNADALEVHSGDTVTYTVVATNTSPDTPMTVTAFIDDHSSTVPSPACDKGIGTVLQPNETIHCTYAASISDDVHNVVSITAKDSLGLKGDPNGVITKTDGTFVKVLNPNIDVVKSANKPAAHDGDLVTYSFKVTNKGDVRLTGVKVTDDVLGDIGTIASLDAGASQTLTKDFTVPAGTGDVVNHVQACGNDPLDKQVCDTDSHNLPRIHPAITLDKKVNGADHATAAGALQVHAGDTVTYSIVAKNTSPDTPLTVTAFSDDHSTTVPNPSCDKGMNAVLQPNETITCAYTAKITDNVHNVASITAKDPLGLTGDPKGVVSATDGTFVQVIHPAISVVKSGPATATAGQTVTYGFKVTNTGDIALSNVQVSDDKLGAVGTIPALAVGESTTLTKDFTVPAGQTAIDNTVTACGSDVLSLQVCATDTHHMDVTQVLGENVVRPTAPLAVTGADLGWRSLIGLLLLAGGVGLRVMRRRTRRSEA
jgi:plastocyanin